MRQLVAACLIGLVSPQVESEEVDASSVVSIRLERTACFGRCPVYSVVAARDGTLSYTGVRNVKVSGERAGKITQRDFDFLASSASHVRFLSLRDQYASKSDGCKEVWTDNPSLRITLQLARSSKTVAYYLGCRGIEETSRITWLADTIDEMTNSAQWIEPSR